MNLLQKATGSSTRLRHVSTPCHEASMESLEAAMNVTVYRATNVAKVKRKSKSKVSESFQRADSEKIICTTILSIF